MSIIKGDVMEQAANAAVKATAGGPFEALSPVDILSFGAIGLGFLLAFLAYRLLSKPETHHGAIYIYMLFCTALVLIGAGIQVYEIYVKSQVEQKEARIADLVAANAEGGAKAKGQMAAIADLLATTYAPLNAVNAHVTDGQVCPGLGHGVPLPAAATDSSNITAAVGKISSAQEIAKQNAQ